MTRSSTVICGHRGGGGDPESVKALTSGVDWSRLGKTPDHYDYREVWENRLSTFKYMLEKGITCFELDLLPSSDGEAMVTHNSIVDGINVWEWSSKELQQKGILPLEVIIDAIEKTQKKVMLLLEAKGSVSSELRTDTGNDGINKQGVQLINKIVDIVNKRVSKHGWNYTQLPLIGFNHLMLAMAKEKNPEIQIGLSYAKEKAKSPSEMIEEAEKAGAYAINPDDRLVTKEMVEAAHIAGLKVQSWTAYRVPERPEEMMNLGVDTLITDCPFIAQELL